MTRQPGLPVRFGLKCSSQFPHNSYSVLRTLKPFETRCGDRHHVVLVPFNMLALKQVHERKSNVGCPVEVKDHQLTTGAMLLELFQHLALKSLEIIH